jgi:hypothetical protein
MADPWLEQLHAWHEFYFMLGTSAAALTGLMFVVVSINPARMRNAPPERTRAFTTPTMVFFTTALVVSALILVPDLPTHPLAALLAALGVSGVVYMLWVRAHQHWRDAKLDREDWLCYVALPFASYLLLVAAAIGVWLRAGFGTATLALGTLLFVLVGIRNAWDLVIFMARERRAD